MCARKELFTSRRTSLLYFAVFFCKSEFDSQHTSVLLTNMVVNWDFRADSSFFILKSLKQKKKNFRKLGKILRYFN